MSNEVGGKSGKNGFLVSLVIGIFVFSVLLYLEEYGRFLRGDIKYVFAIFTLYNVICCMFYSAKRYKMTVWDILKAAGLVMVLGWIFFICFESLFPIDYSGHLFGGLDGLIFVFAPIMSISCLVPFVIYKILYAVGKVKWYIPLAIVLSICYIVYLAFP